MFEGIDFNKSILNDWFLNHVLNGLNYLSCLNKGIDFKRFVELNKGFSRKSCWFWKVINMRFYSQVSI